MPTIEDLKKRNLSASISVEDYTEDTTNAKPVKSAATISMLTGNEAAEVIDQYNSDVKNGIDPAAKKRRSERVEADFSSIPATDGSENEGLLESPQAEIFKKGGPFDQYVSEKVEEFKEWQTEKIKEAEDKQIEEDLKESAEGAPIEEDSEEEFQTTITPAVNGRLVDVRARKESKMAQEKINEEVLIDKDEYVDNTDMEDFEVDEFDDRDPETVPTKAVEELVNNINKEAEIHNAEEVISVEDIPEEVEPEQPKSENTSPKIHKITKTIISVDEHDIFDEDDEEPTAEITDEDDDLSALKALISKKIAPVSKKLDISHFTIAKKGTESNNIFESKEAAVAKWVLPATGITILLREISGSNLEMIRSMLGRRPADVKGALKIIYDHIVSAKPSTFEAWTKSIAFADYDHLFMAIYIASFIDSNFLPIDCDNDSCKKTYLTEDIDIMDMVKFKDDISKEKFDNLYNSDAVNPKGLYVTEVAAISNKFAIAFKEPDINSVLIESQYFNDRDNRRYQQTIALLPYIDTVYLIDVAHGQLVPVEFKTFVNEPAKTARYKVKKLDAIINTLNVDENAMLSAYTQAINERTDWFSYQIPETTCPYCGHVHPAIEDQSASSLVFLRNRLGALVTI